MIFIPQTPGIPSYQAESQPKLLDRLQALVLSNVVSVETQVMYLSPVDTLVCSVYNSRSASRQNSVFHAKSGIVVYHKPSCDFTSEEFIYLCKMFDRVRGKRLTEIV